MLDISPILLVSTLIVFLILIALLNSWLYNPLINYMNARDAGIKKDLADVSDGGSEIADLEKRAEKIINDAKLEAMALRERVVADAKELAESKLEAKRAEMASEYLEFKESLQKEQAVLRESLLAQVPMFKETVKAKLSQI
jgi:F-type H+-transporting ATPase subunit b